MEYYKTGKLVAVHGLKGEVVYKHDLGKRTTFKGLKAIFIEDKQNSFIPWFIETVRIKNENEAYLKIEGVETREAANVLTQKQVWLPETDFRKFAASSSPAGLLGYTVINESTALGKILEVIQQPHQLLCRLEISGKEVLIPLNEEFLKNIDHRKKTVETVLPDGLLDIYLT